MIPIGRTPTSPNNFSNLSYSLVIPSDALLLSSRPRPSRVCHFGSFGLFEVATTRVKYYKGVTLVLSNRWVQI